MLAGCNDAAHISSRGPEPTGGAAAAFGALPAAVTEAPEAELTRCEVVGDAVVVEIVVANTRSQARRPLAVDYTVTAGDGRVFDETVVPHGPDLGAGRRRRYREEISARTPLAGSVCALGDVEWEAGEGGAPGRALATWSCSGAPTTSSP